jgi:tetratricopeptide (TPR) repeat protein
MTNLQKLFMILAFSSLVSCDNEGSRGQSDVQRTSAPELVQPMGEVARLNAMLAENPESFDALSELGDVYFESGRYQEAIQTYEKAIAVNPMCADCLNDKGLAMYFTGNPEGALASFDKATQVAPEYVNAWLSKGYVLVVEKRYEEAIAPLNKVKELAPQSAMAMEADRFLQMAMSESFQ